MLVFEGLENSGPFLFHVVAGLRGAVVIPLKNFVHLSAENFNG